MSASDPAVDFSKPSPIERKDESALKSKVYFWISIIFPKIWLVHYDRKKSCGDSSNFLTIIRPGVRYHRTLPGIGYIPKQSVQIFIVQ